MRALNKAELAEYGITNVVEIPGFETRTTNARAAFTPVGFMAHHTAGRDSLGLITRNAISQYHIPKSGVINIVALGRTGHPGYGAPSVLEDCRNDIAPRGDASRFSPRALDPTSHLDPTTASRIAGFQWFIGAEVENLGDGNDPYPDVQLDALFRLAAAHCAHFGWSSNRVIHHREWTSRKIDMSWYGDLRGAVSGHLASFGNSATKGPSPVSLHPEAQKAKQVGIWDGSNAKTDATREQSSIMAHRAREQALDQALGVIGQYKAALDQVVATVDAQAARIDALETQLAAHTANHPTGSAGSTRPDGPIDVRIVGLGGA